MRVIYASVIIVLANTAIAADSACVKISEPLDRLACYDKQFKRGGEVEKLSVKSDWNISVKTSPLTDDKNIYLDTKSNEDIGCRRFGDEKPIRLMVRCQENTTTLLIATHCHLTSSRYNNYGDVEYRIDDEKASVWSMVESTDNEVLGLWSGGKSIPQIKKMLGKSKLTVRITPFSESPFIATFNIAGLEESIKPLREACSW